MLPFYRVSSDCQAGLIEELEKLMIYDCHEHLPPANSIVPAETPGRFFLSSARKVLAKFTKIVYPI